MNYFIYIAKPSNLGVKSICDHLGGRKTYKPYLGLEVCYAQELKARLNLIERNESRNFVSIFLCDYQKAALKQLKNLPEGSIDLLTITEPEGTWLTRKIPKSVLNVVIFVKKDKLNRVKLTCDPLKTRMALISLSDTQGKEVSECAQVQKQQVSVIDRILKVN